MNEKKAKLIRQLARAEGLPDNTARLTRRLYANSMPKKLDRASFAMLIYKLLHTVANKTDGK